MAQTFVPSYLLDPANSPYQNILINGGFESWNYGTSFTNPPTAVTETTPILLDNWIVATNEIATVTVTRESSIVDSGAYSLKAVLTGSGASKYWTLQQYILSNAYRGKTITLSARVFTSTANAVRVAIQDNLGVTYSSYHTGGGGWETLTLTKTISATTPDLYIYIGMAATNDKKNGTYYFDSAMLVIGSSPVTFVPDLSVITDLRTSDQNLAQNILINGGMEFWQRGISFNNPSNLQYVADRWKVRASVITGVLVTQESATANKDRGNYSMKVVNTTSGGRWNIQQDIEDFLSYSGKTVTATCRIKCDTASAVRIAIGNNTSIGAYSSFHTGGNTFETLAVSVTLANPETDLSVHIGFIDTGNKVPATFYIDSVMLVLGSSPVAFVPKDPQTELAQCQRYYEKSYLPSVAPGTSTTVNVVSGSSTGGTGQCYSCWFPFKVSKRTNPAVVFYDSAGNSGKFDWSVVGAAPTSRVTNPQTSGGLISTEGVIAYHALGTTDNFCGGHFTASAEL